MQGHVERMRGNTKIKKLNINGERTKWTARLHEKTCNLGESGTFLILRGGRGKGGDQRNTSRDSIGLKIRDSLSPSTIIE